MTKTSIPKLHSITMKSGPFAGGVIHPVEFPAAERIPAVNVLEGAILENLRDVVLVGYTQTGEEYIAGSMRSPKEAAYMFARAHLVMLRKSDP